MDVWLCLLGVECYGHREVGDLSVEDSGHLLVVSGVKVVHYVQYIVNNNNNGERNREERTVGVCRMYRLQRLENIS